MAKENHLSYKPSIIGMAKIEELRNAVIALDDLLDDLVGSSREKSIAKTHLEDFRMWAVTSIIRQHNKGAFESQGTVSGQEDMPK